MLGSIFVMSLTLMRQFLVALAALCVKGVVVCIASVAELILPLSEAGPVVSPKLNSVGIIARQLT